MKLKFLHENASGEVTELLFEYLRDLGYDPEMHEEPGIGTRRVSLVLRERIGGGEDIIVRIMVWDDATITATGGTGQRGWPNPSVKIPTVSKHTFNANYHEPDSIPKLLEYIQQFIKS